MRFFQRLLDLVFPPLCLVCQKPVGEAHRLCGACWSSVRFITEPRCACCGMPFDFPVSEDTLCGECLTAKPLYAKARSAVVYDEASKGMILRLKHADHLHLAEGLARMMVTAGAELWPEVDLILPVPLHRFRLFFRRYNQAALLASAVGKIAGKPVELDALRRLHATPSQGHMKKEERHKNVAKAFSVPSSKVARIAGKRVLLIDDVFTTGATVEACTGALLKAGASSVCVLTFAKTHKT